ncbi:MAG: hypothetical protein J4A00_10450 [Gammaproteobacteria bacterium]|nr:hypothetical protein [Gammaproteobacteria bacterium]
MADSLPKQFSALEPWREKWAKAHEQDRRDARLASTIEELTAFYDVMLAAIDDIVAHLNRWKLEDLPDPERLLLRMCLSFMDISRAVEHWGEPDLPPTDSPDHVIRVVREVLV